MHRSQFLFLSLFIPYLLVRCNPPLSEKNQEIWFTYPGKYWNSQALHLGNGYFGASFLGGVDEETIYITDASMWTGGPAKGDWQRAGVNPKALESLPMIRNAVTNGNIQEADSLVSHNFLGKSDLYGFFSSIGALKIKFNDQANYSQYRRSLSLSDAIGSISYASNGVNFSREYFCSYPDKTLALHFTADRDSSISFDLGIDVIQDSSNVEIQDNVFVVNGFIDGNQRPFQVLIKVIQDGGKLGKLENRLTLENANSATLFITMSTNYTMAYPDYEGYPPSEKNIKVMEKVIPMGYQRLKERHINDYQSLYDRVQLEIEQDPELAALPTDKRYDRLKSGQADPGYKELAFNLGRYMVISASRPGTLPANLQGVWNAFHFAPWAGNYQSNVNIQEIYWSCGPLNLPECQQPYIDWINDLAISGTEIAKSVYGTNGWISHTIGNIYGHAAPIGSLIWGMYSMGSAWHCQHVWDQFSFTQDTSYLAKQAYPLLRDASIFWLENLIPYKNHYITSPTVSAEHGALLTNEGLNPAYHDLPSDKYRYNIPGAYQDIQMLWDLFTNTAEAGEILGHVAFADSLINTRDSLLPLKIGKHGQLQEWYEDIDRPDCHHRHIAHLYAVAPGRQISPISTPELAVAAKKSLDMRGDGRYMDQEVAAGGNWSRAHRMWAWTRLLDGERANKIMTEILTEQGFENVLSYQHAPYSGNDGPDMFTEPSGMHCNWQLDATGALPGCIAEMLIQSHLGEIHLLPALPTEFKSGKLTGVKARGGHTVDLEWQDMKLVKAKIVSSGTATPKIRVKGDVVDSESDKRIEIKKL